MQDKIQFVLQKLNEAKDRSYTTIVVDKNFCVYERYYPTYGRPDYFYLTKLNEVEAYTLSKSVQAKNLKWDVIPIKPRVRIKAGREIF